MDDDADAKMILTAPPPENWKSPTRTTRASPYHVAEHRPARSESLQPHTGRSSRPGSEPPSVGADVYLWRYALLVVLPKKKKNIYCRSRFEVDLSRFFQVG